MTDAINPPYTVPSNAVCDGHGSNTVRVSVP
jgi:hypothetical protein